LSALDEALLRLWSLHPRHLDRRGLVALWREGLLAQAVLRGRTRGYRNHPQLLRFAESASPVATIVSYLEVVRLEALRRGYSFDRSRLARRSVEVGTLPVSRGQLEFEWRHLLAKVAARDPVWYREIRATKPRAHPLLRVRRGPIAEWERV
jgi:hypothetical protein